MPFLTLEQDNREQVVAALDQHPWLVACLCAAWCGSCREYRSVFEQLAARHPEVSWIWIDIEDQADVVGDIDVENFPTLLIQHEGLVTYFGAVAPSLPLAERLLLSQMEQSDAQRMAEINTSHERRQWQAECNLRTLLGADS